MNLINRPMIIVANKMDVPGAEENLKEFKKHVDAEIFEISALEKKNLKPLLYKIADTLETTDAFSLFEEDELDVVEYGLKEEEEFFHIEKDSDGVFNVSGKGLEKLFNMTDFDSEVARHRFARQLRTYGLDDKLRKLGVKNGDTVRLLDFEFEFVE